MRGKQIRQVVVGVLVATNCTGGVMAEEPHKIFSRTTYDHFGWAEVLLRFVDADGQVDYASLEDHPQALESYLDQVKTISPMNRPELFPSQNHALAYYVNAYNALVFRGVLNLPAGKDTVWGWTGTGAGFFVGNKYQLGGERMSLNKLENEIVRAQFHDPRIHAALNCASRGCPRLPQEPFEAEILDSQLTAAMTEFVNQEGNCRYDSASTTVHLSKIFDWFRSDFKDYEAGQAGSGGTLIDYLNRFRGAVDPIPAQAKIVGCVPNLVEIGIWRSVSRSQV